MKIDGSCHCGNIKFTAEIDPEKVRICHCTDCQTLTGTAYRVGVTSLKGSFRLTSGTPKVYVKTTADSGIPREQGFCGDCGTPLYSTTVGDGPKVYGLRVGAIRQRAELKPRQQQWCRSAQAWTQDLRGVPQVAKQG